MNIKKKLQINQFQIKTMTISNSLEERTNEDKNNNLGTSILSGTSLKFLGLSELIFIRN